MLWLLGAIGIVAGLVDWLLLDGLPWEGFGAALVIAAVTRVAAQVTGISAWPWTDRGHARRRRLTGRPCHAPDIP